MDAAQGHMTGLDLFCGCGGASLGLSRAGVALVGAWDFDAAAIRGHRALLPDCPAHQADLSTVESLPAVDVWWASPPCQPFSAAGKRQGAKDERDGYPHLLRLLEASPRPTWLCIENVPGLARHVGAASCGALFAKPDSCPGCYLDAILRKLDRWFPVVESRILDAADYGVPQHRERHITVCGPARIQWPEPTHGPGRRLPYVSAGEALGLRVFGGGTNPHGKDAAHERTLRELTDEPATTVPASDAGNNSLMALSVGGPNACNGRGPSVIALSDPGPVVRANSDIYIVAAGLTSEGGHAEGRPRELDRPAPTVGARGTVQLVTGSDGATYQRLRTLTVPERAALQALPWHPALTGKVVGNAVPPPLAEVVVRAVMAAHARLVEAA